MKFKYVSTLIFLIALASLQYIPKSTSLIKFQKFQNKSKTQSSVLSPKPNIILILTDDQDKDSIRYMENLNSLFIDKGMSFDNFISSTPVCCPSRSTILTGLYSHNTGIKKNGPPDGGFPKFYESGKENFTIANWLQSVGYRTVLIGKYLNHYPETAPATYIPPGWSEWHGQIGGKFYYDYSLNENGEIVNYGKEITDYSTDVFTAKAVDFINRSVAESKPFFLYLSFHAPHDNAKTAPRHKNMFLNEKVPRTPSFNEIDVTDKPEYVKVNRPLSEQEIANIDRWYQKRLRTLLAVDESLKTLYDTLVKNKQINNTYMFYTSDNGFHQGQHRLKHGKGRPYEEDILLPLIVRGPNIPRNSHRQHLLGTNDLAPTFAEIANVPIPTEVDGRSFVPLLKRNSPNLKNWRKSYLLQNWPGEPRLDFYHGIRTLNSTYVEYNTGEKELYDLKNDPYQLSNIIPTTSKRILKLLSEKLNILKECSSTQCFNIENQSIKIQQ